MCEGRNYRHQENSDLFQIGGEVVTMKKVSVNELPRTKQTFLPATKSSFLPVGQPNFVNRPQPLNRPTPANVVFQPAAAAQKLPVIRPQKPAVTAGAVFPQRVPGDSQPTSTLFKVSGELRVGNEDARVQQEQKPRWRPGTVETIKE